MAIPILNHLDLRSVSELQNAILHKTTTGNATDVEGKIIYDTGTNSPKVYDGNTWIDLGGDIRQVKITDDSSVAYDVTAGNFDLVISGDTGITTKFNVDGNGALTSPVTLEIDLDNTSVTAGSYGSSTAIPTFTVDAQGRLTAAGSANVATALTIDSDGTDSSDTADVDLLTDDLKIIGTSNEIETQVSKSGTDVSLQIGLPNDVTIGNDLTVTNDLTVSVNASVTGNLSVDGTSNLDDTDIDGTLVVDGSNISLDSTSTLNIDNSNTTNGITIGTATADVPVTIGNASSEVTIGDNLTVEGNFTVKGTQTTLNETVKVVENNTIEFEGTTDDVHEMKFTGGDPTADRLIALPDNSGTVALTSDITARQFSTTIGDNSATTINLLNSGASAPHKNHGLGADSTQFMIQLIEVDTGLTAMADVVRGSSGAVAITFAQKPDTDKIRVLINKIG
tara:strand:- start:2090 stop:3442 length:1353 start_codon:yes stop_codon:yes gene_type:complete